MTTTTSANPATPERSSRLRRLRRTLYRGDPGMWSWVLHRITGATVFFFLFIHVLDTALVRISPQAYDEVISTYKTPIVGLMELGLVAAVLYHALNGVRVILIDFWAQGPRYQRLMLWTIGIVWLLLDRLVLRPIDFPAGFEHLLDRHPGPARDDGGDLLGVDHLRGDRDGVAFLLLVREALLERRDLRQRQPTHHFAVRAFHSRHIRQKDERVSPRGYRAC